MALNCLGGFAPFEYVDALFDSVAGPYTIDKGVQLIYQPSPSYTSESEPTSEQEKESAQSSVEETSARSHDDALSQPPASILTFSYPGTMGASASTQPSSSDEAPEDDRLRTPMALRQQDDFGYQDFTVLRTQFSSCKP